MMEMQAAASLEAVHLASCYPWQCFPMHEAAAWGGLRDSRACNMSKNVRLDLLAGES